MISKRFFVHLHRVLACLLCLSMPVAALAAPVQSTLPAIGPEYEAASGPAILSIGNRDVVTFHATIGDARPIDRILAAEKQVAQLSDRELGAPITVKETKLGGMPGLAVHVGSTKLFGLLEGDIDPLSDHTLQDEADLAARNLSIALKALQLQRQPEIILRGVALSSVAIVLFALAAWLIVRVRIRVTRRLDASARRGLDKIVLHGVDLATPMTLFLEGITAFISWVALFLAAYVCAAVVLGSFPYTALWSDMLASNLMRLFQDLGQRMVRSLPEILTVTVIFIIARMSARLLSAFMRAIEDEKVSTTFLYPDTARATRWLLLAVIWLFALAIAYPHIPGSDSAAFQGISVIAGLMLSLGSAGIVNQAMNGLVLVYSRALVQGDVVKIDDEKGVVTNVGLLSTKIKTCRSEEITIPNTVVVSTQIKNFSRQAPGKGATTTTSVLIGYDTSWRQVVAMLTLAARKTQGARQDVAPYVLQRRLANFYVHYDLIVFIERPDAYELVLNELHGHIQDIFNEHGVQIMTPNFETQPDKKVMVPKERWFAPPADRDGNSENVPR